MATPSLARNTIMLTLSGGVEFALQFAVPMVFVRHLDPDTFGQYRLLWLMAGTALAIAPAFMPQSLFYFLPRADVEQKRVYIGNVLGYLAAAGCVVAFLASRWNPFLPANVATLFADTNGISALFIGAWLVVSLMSTLPTAEGRVRWQATSDVSLSVFRTALLVGAAVFTRALEWVVAALLLEAAVRLSLMLAYLRTRPEGGHLSIRIRPLLEQLRYALPFAFGNSLFGMRLQSDQWVAASMLPPALFGMFTIGAVFLPIASLIRQPINNAMMPRLNKAFAEGRYEEIRHLFGKSSAAAALLLVPAGGALFCMADLLVQIVYTGKYAAAVPVMRVYLIGMMLQPCAAGHLLPALNKGRVAVVNNGCCLALSITCSWLGARQWGMIGAASGSVLAFAVSELWSLAVVARTLGVALPAMLPLRAFGIAALGTAVAAAGVELFEGALPGAAFMQLLLKGTTFAALYTAVFLGVGGFAQVRALRAGIPLAATAPPPHRTR